MKTMMAGALRAALATTTILGTATLLAAPAMAQTTTASIRGQVRDAAGAPVTGATVVAVNRGTNQTLRGTTGASGAFVLNGVRPGEYAFTATGPNGDVFTQRIIIAIGQAATLDVRLAPAAPAPAAAPTTGDTASADAAPATEDGQEIVVTGSRLVETRTSEIATNVSQDQIRRLPQTDRNFLSFAALAPGVRYNDSETDKSISSGGSTASQVNVFIDGVSLKNQVFEGGIAGQQNSRGNPFGQLAIQEFRVITQNYKAEYEQAGAAVITAVTKSGTNEFHGEVFGQYTDRSLSSTDFFVKQAGGVKPAFERKQYGIALGGPIIKDKLFFFGTYEGNDQDRAFNVRLGNRTAANIARFGQYEGAFVSPFRGDFYFGKLTFTPDERQVFDLSFSRRTESDVQGFGNQIAFEVAENKLNTVDTYNYKWTYTGDGFVNEFNASYLNYVFNPTSLNPGLPTNEYRDVITFGGKDSIRRYVQSSYIIRNDLTYNALAGHVIKGGLRIGFQDYEANDVRFAQPRYTYINGPDQGLSFDFPAEARLGLGNSRIAASNLQLGAYIQDDWDVTDKLQLNLGLRWDFETNQFNNEYVTPAAAAATLRALPQTEYFRSEDYITDGNDRPPRTDLFQPRIGFSYDFSDDQRTVIFGGYGKYYDRNAFINTLDEKYRQQYLIGTFYFSRDGRPRDGNPTVIFNPSYLTRDGLLALQATAQTGRPELFAVKNNPKVQSTDQFSLGLRQRVGIFQTSLTASYVKGQNGYTHLFATRNPDGSCCNTAIANANGFANVLIGTDQLETRYKALFFTVDKPFTEASGWGINIAYTFSKGKQNGNDLFSLDKETAQDYGFRPRPGDERHRLVLSGTLGLPVGFRLSTLTTLGSGGAFQVNDRTAGSGINDLVITSAYPRKNCIDGLLAFCEVNLTLENNIRVFGDHTINVAVDLLNAFNNKNFGGFNSDLTSAEFSTPSNLITLPRRVQFRAGYRF